MNVEIKKLSVDDGVEIYEMLQAFPENENGFINSMHGKSFDAYKRWLADSVYSSKQVGIIDGWFHRLHTGFLKIINQ